jgi:beta-lactam-binding protein with PASTA domain
MKDAISLLAAILGLSTAVIVLLAALNKTDTVEVPVVREVAVLQPSNPPPPAPTTTDSTETPTETPTVPQLEGSSQEDAVATLAALSLGADREAAAPELCASNNLSSGQVANTDPPAGMPLEEGDTTVTLHVCE